MNECGFCGACRETGDVCCISQARNQGRLHATCNHEPPPMPASWLREYEEATAIELERGEKGLAIDGTAC